MRRRTFLFAALWGLAEGTVLFVVPDVFLSFVALRHLREALFACLWAVAGALVGGTLMFLWGAADPAAAEAVLDAIPAISPGMIAAVREQMTGSWPVSLFVGSLTGTPYKVYAVEAGASGVGLALFWLATIPARLFRFAVASLALGALARGPLASWPLARRRWLLLAAWVAFYLYYWSAMPN